GGSPRLSYHLALLALEEIGKARILRMKIMSESVERESPASINRALDDHIRKLFWAIWGGSMAGELTPQDFVDHVGLATRLHEKRIAGLYVDRLDSGEVAVPTAAITMEETRDLLRFVDAAFHLAKPGVLDQAETREGTERVR